MVPFLSSRRFLAAYSGVLTIVFAATVLLGARPAASNASFNRITVHRIDVVEPDGTERLAISNKDAFPGSYLHGKEIARPDRNDAAGLLLLNDQGTEDGGFLWGGKRDAAGKPSSFGHLSFDQYDQDQTLTMGSSLDPDGKRRTSVQLNDVGPWFITAEAYAEFERLKQMPEGPARAAASQALERKYAGNVPRAALARRDDASVGLELSDKAGQVRARLTVKPDGQPALEFLDAQGKVQRTISGTEGK